MKKAMTVDVDLEKYSESSFANSLGQFLVKGGAFITLDKEVKPFKFYPGDIVFPSCSGANNRSQTLWNLLRAYIPLVTVMKPHATRYGLDPYNGIVNWHRTKHAFADDEFILWSGVPKSTKFGFDLFESLLTKKDASEKELDQLWNYYNENYYNPPTSSRRVYITFAQNAHVHLFRLNQANDTLENVVLVAFPLADLIAAPLDEWNTYPRSTQTYIHLSALIAKYLDFSAVNFHAMETLKESNKSHLSP